MCDDLIQTVGLVHIRDGQLLLARTHGQNAFFVPGGKPSRGEGAVAALHREVHEELGTTIVAGTVRPYGVFEDRAYGRRVTVRVRITCYLGELEAAPVPRSEIAELGYFGWAEYEAQQHKAPAVLSILRDLQGRGFIPFDPRSAER